MTIPLVLHPDRALPADPATLAAAREILAQTEPLPIVSMHGHVEADLLADNLPFPDPAELLIRPDHYLTRMLGSQGIDRASLGLPEPGAGPLADPRATWRTFCANWKLYRGTPTRYWLTDVFGSVFGLTEHPDETNADELYDQLSARLARPEYRPLALLDRFRIETIATTDAAWDTLSVHEKVEPMTPTAVLPTMRPDVLFALADPDWRANLARLEAADGSEITSYAQFLDALRRRRAHFVAHGALATDHGALSTDTTPLSDADASRLFADALAGTATAAGEAAFIANMIFQMAAMSCDDGLVLQFHPGALRNYAPDVAARWGRDVGYDIPVPVDYVHGLAPLLTAFGHCPSFRMIIFTLDEDTFSRELAPLAGVFPALKLGAPWWFLDTPGGMRRFRDAVTDSAGFYNTTGFVDDTRAFCSIPARHNLARRIDAGYLGGLVATHLLGLDEAIETGIDLAYRLPKSAYARQA